MEIYFHDSFYIYELEFFKSFLFSSYLFNYFISAWAHDTCFILWVIIHYHYLSSNSTSLSHWESFQVGSCVLLLCLLIFWAINHKLFQAHPVPASKTFPQKGLVPLIGKCYSETKNWVLTVMNEVSLPLDPTSHTHIVYISVAIYVY